MQSNDESCRSVLRQTSIPVSLQKTCKRHSQALQILKHAPWDHLFSSDRIPNPISQAIASLNLISVCRDDEDKVVFQGWARMAVPLLDFSVIEVRKPNLGENKPGGVTADAVFTVAGERKVTCTFLWK